MTGAIEVSSNQAMWAAVAGWFVPLLISAIVQTGWDSRAKSLAAFAVCVGVAAVTAWLAGQLTLEDLVTSGLIVVVTAKTSYEALWKPTGVAPAIERATSRRAA